VFDAKIQDIKDIATDAKAQLVEVESVSAFAANEVVLDIRSADERDEKPLEIEGVEVAHLPFFKLGNQFETLAQDKTYLLYCDRGVMSQLQALYLKEAGFENVKVYRP